MHLADVYVSSEPLRRWSRKQLLLLALNLHLDFEGEQRRLLDAQLPLEQLEIIVLRQS